MHYGDTEQLENNSLNIVIYKHGTPKEDVFEYMVESIQSCKYFPPNILKNILTNPNKYFSEKFKNKKSEEFYLTTIKIVDINDTLTWSIKNVSKRKNEFYRLH